MKVDKKEYIEIDVTRLGKSIWSKKWLIIIIGVVSTLAMVVFDMFIVKPTYQSTTKFYAVGSLRRELTIQDLQVGLNLVKDYQEIILSADVLNRVIDKKNLMISKRDLAGKVKISSPANTRVVEIRVEDTDPRLASTLANELREEAITKIKKITKIKDIGVIEVAKPASLPSSPKIKRDAILAFGIGVILSSLFWGIRELMDERIKTPEEVEDGLGLKVLGVIPKLIEDKS